jgi:hypothetical protein
MIITKNDLIQALKRNFKKKNALLYLYFQELFDSAHSSAFVRMKIFEEIGIELTKIQLDTIRYRMDKTNAKKMKANTTIATYATNEPILPAYENKSSFSDPFQFGTINNKRNIKRLE